jgi:hypothetical protein
MLFYINIKLVKCNVNFFDNGKNPIGNRNLHKVFGRTAKQTTFFSGCSATVDLRNTNNLSKD